MVAATSHHRQPTPPQPSAATTPPQPPPTAGNTTTGDHHRRRILLPFRSQIRAAARPLSLSNHGHATLSHRSRPPPPAPPSRKALTDAALFSLSPYMYLYIYIYLHIHIYIPTTTQTDTLPPPTAVLASSSPPTILPPRFSPSRAVRVESNPPRTAIPGRCLLPSTYKSRVRPLLHHPKQPAFPSSSFQQRKPTSLKLPDRRTVAVHSSHRRCLRIRSVHGAKTRRCELISSRAKLRQG